jgi:hypothetical protein
MLSSQGVIRNWDNGIGNASSKLNVIKDNPRFGH